MLGATTYFEGSGVPTTPADLTRHPAVIYTEDCGGTDTWSFRRGATEVSVRIAGRLRVSASEGLRAAVLSGIGLAITSQWMFVPELAAGKVRAVLTDWALPPSDLWAVFPPGRLGNVKARAFADFVEAELYRRRLEVGMDAAFQWAGEVAGV